MKSTSRTILSAGALHMAIVLSALHTNNNVEAFAPYLAPRSDLRQDVGVNLPLRSGTSIFESSDDNDASTPDDAPAPVEYPALSDEEITKMLDAIPLYAVTGADKQGLVLLREPDNENEIAYFFFSPDVANSVYAPLKAKKDDGIAWSVMRFPLGFIWFELLKNPSEPGTTVFDGVEYRLVPDARELAGARSIAQHTEMAENGGKAPEGAPKVFIRPYNEIPIFMDQFLRIEGTDGEDAVPMYFGLQDLIQTCQQATGGEGQYQARINIADLHSIVKQMQSKSTVNFRQAALIPPTPLPLEEEKPDVKPEQPPDEIEMPTTTGMWDD